MNVTELRIGSIVGVINRNHTVHMPYGWIKKVGQIQFFNVHLYESDKPFAVQADAMVVDVADLSPIPLTEQWLLKLGFENGKIYLPTFCYLEVAEDGSIAFTDHVSHDEATKYLATNKNPVRYVHQLQNLYFALTGDELTIKKTDAPPSTP